MKILITGTNGFVGKNLRQYFQTRYKDISCPKRQELNLLDTDAVGDYLKKNEFNVVIHCGVTLSSVEDNLKMYFNLENSSNTYGKMVCIGSGAEYNKGKYVDKIKEADFGKHIPGDIYGFS